MFGRVVFIFVDTHHDSNVFISGRGADDNLFGLAVQMFGGAGAVSKTAAGLNNNFHSVVPPGNGSRVRKGEGFDVPAVNPEFPLFIGINVGFQIAVYRVKPKKVRQSTGVGEIVHCNDLNILPVHGGPVNSATDPAEAVNSHFYCHWSDSSFYNPV